MSLSPHPLPGRIVIGRLDAVQVPHEEILHPPDAVRPAVGMVHTGDDEQVEILAGLDERIDEAERRFRRDIVVQFADDQQQLALQFGGVGDVGRGA